MPNANIKKLYKIQLFFDMFMAPKHAQKRKKQSITKKIKTVPLPIDMYK